nr:hypothetical protein [uncultured Rhodoferax sp.]
MAAAPKTSWFKATLANMGFGPKAAQAVDQVGFEYGESLTMASLMGAGVESARNRQQIYQKYQQMIKDPVVGGALRLHVTAALGGDETTGDLVLIEPTAEAKKNAQSEKLAKEINDDLRPLFNRVAQLVAYNGVAFGDAFARIYTKPKKGVVDLYCDEMLLPPLVQPYEKGNQTKVCVLAIGSKMRERLTMNQIARMKMPRLIYTPQPMAVEKAWRSQITEDDPDKLPLMPSLVGGSFLADAEGQFDKFNAAMSGLVGQRVLDSIDESMFTAQVQGMTKEQRQEFLTAIKKMLQRSKQVADDAVKSGIPFLGRIRHILPVFDQKQLLQIQGVNTSGGSGGGRSGNISIEDVLFHAKLLSGSLGVDITMLGFADLMSGGLGDGGFFRTSAQAAERSRTIRSAMSEFFNHIADIHVLYKYGKAFEPKDRPWAINYYGSISALESEHQKTQSDAMNTGAVLVQTLMQAKDLGMDAAATMHLLETVMKLDTAASKLYADAIEKARPSPEGTGAGGFGGAPGGGFGS